MHMEEPCFDFLRTKETLGWVYRCQINNIGVQHSSTSVLYLKTKSISASVTSRYQVYPTCRNTSGVLGFSVTVETQATKYR